MVQDPDGDGVTREWSVYEEASTVASEPRSLGSGWPVAARRRTRSSRWTNRGAVDAAPDGSTPRDYSTARFFSAIQEDFAARLQWTVTDRFEDANHAPSITVRQGVDIRAKAGATVPLTAAVLDPDGDAVDLTWWQYREAGTYPGGVDIERGGTER